MIELKIAIISFMWIVILSHEKCCSWWFQFGIRFEKYWFYAPIWGCELCFSGQVALWTYLWLHITRSGARFYFSQYNIFEHVFFVLFTIFCTLIISKLYDKIKTN